MLRLIHPTHNFFYVYISIFYTHDVFCSLLHEQTDIICLKSIKTFENPHPLHVQWTLSVPYFEFKDSYLYFASFNKRKMHYFRIILGSKCEILKNHEAQTKKYDSYKKESVYMKILFERNNLVSLFCLH